MKRFWLIAFLLLTITGASQNTLEVDGEFISPEAKLSDVSWIIGHWRGNAFGGKVEEVWLPPFGNSIVGTFKLVKENTIVFYEILTISEENNSLVLRLKHFDAKLNSWEEKDNPLQFSLVKITPTKVYFNGLTFEKVSILEMNVYIKDKLTELKFNYHKV